MGITITLRGGSGDMNKIVYDPDLDGKIADAELHTQPQDLSFLLDKATYAAAAGDKIPAAVINQVLLTLPSEVMDGYLYPGFESQCNSLSYAVQLQRGFCFKKGGEYKFGAGLRTSNASYPVYLGYKINGGSWVDIGSTASTTHVMVKMTTGIVLNDGDIAEVGIKCANAGYSTFIQAIYSWISKVNRIE